MKAPWRKIALLAGCLEALLWAGCTSATSTIPPAAAVATETATPTASLPAPTRPARPQQTPTATTTPEVIDLPVLATPVKTQVEQVCSPLKDHLLQELPEIISSPYAPPPMGKDDRHQGVDFSYYRRGERLSIQGVVVQSVLPGKVAASISDSFPFGNSIIVETANSDLPEWLRDELEIAPEDSLYILYAHLDQPPESALGELVAACQPIGLVGKSGNAGVAHLHFETRTGLPGQMFPEMGYYKPNFTDAAKENYLLWSTSGAFLHFDPMRLLLAEQQP